jgi:hypothetical protein
MADKLFDLLLQLDVADPEAFIAGTVAILAEYPRDILLAAIDPVHGIPSRTDRPTLRLIKVVCDELYEPFVREEEQRRARDDAQAALEPPRKPRTLEQQAAVDAQVAAARLELGIPQNGLARRGLQPPSVRHDPERTKRLLEDLAARRATQSPGCRRQDAQPHDSRPTNRGTSGRTAASRKDRRAPLQTPPIYQHPI